jgi:FkbM family methyltransferase
MGFVEDVPLRRRDRAAIGLMRAIGRTLGFLRLREPLLRAQRKRKRERRLAEEAKGSDRLSRPALNDLDRKLDAIIDRDGGFFVEAGANDGFTQSNTYWLQRFRAWRGLLVEPVPELAAEARITRPDTPVVECALVGPEDDGTTVRMNFGGCMSAIQGAVDEGYSQFGTLGWADSYEMDVPARTLSSLFDEHGIEGIDLLSLDVEGFEVGALSGLDLSRHRPRYILVEIVDKENGQPPIDAMLLEHYREHSWLSAIDCLYVRNDVETVSSPATKTNGT